MITPIEIKVNLDGDVAAALRRLRCLDTVAAHRDIWFAEPPHPGTVGAPTLLSSRIVIRLRSGEEHDDLTVKLRPCVRSQLTGRWAAPFTEPGVRYRIESDWSADRRMLSASAISSRPPGTLRAVATRGVDVTDALHSAQRQFLVSCTPPGVAVDHLRAIGPVSSARWTGVPVGNLRADVERWNTAGLDLVELSLKVAPQQGDSPVDLHLRALEAQRELEAALRGHRVMIAAGDTKTEQVLTALTTTRPLG
ncbi:hypothetical protein [Nocardia alba]|uniref:CYTH domain-containing protein n=1 Tax=Nocardia alba TaxID=225051 RepID=A0A4R1FZC9_9NOCA|nr:hypothetical protein [Nocardia alba]TCJ96681.1 hypothetical protein DFR71_2712 [Nocardia alba]